ncbi:hypothetical protein [Pseudomonas veronii]|uniref:hypothetical protein n=1 Tax=Pseudomonas veronii TaxID=76761 RepID=UPI001F0CF155|nr:hypothetical protein [Pseudomonas veronii]
MSGLRRVFAAVFGAGIGQFGADLDERTVADGATGFVLEAGALLTGRGVGFLMPCAFLG